MHLLLQAGAQEFHLQIFKTFITTNSFLSKLSAIFDYRKNSSIQCESLVKILNLPTLKTIQRVVYIGQKFLQSSLFHLDLIRS